MLWRSASNHRKMHLQPVILDDVFDSFSEIEHNQSWCLPRHPRLPLPFICNLLRTYRAVCAGTLLRPLTFINAERNCNGALLRRRLLPRCTFAFPSSWSPGPWPLCRPPAQPRGRSDLNHPANFRPRPPPPHRPATLRPRPSSRPGPTLAAAKAGRRALAALPDDHLSFRLSPAGRPLYRR